MPQISASYVAQVKRIGTLVGTEPRERLVRKREDILRQGEPATDAHILIKGLACRHQLLRNGRRAIIAFLLPGDLCEVRSQLGRPADYGITALTTCALAVVAASQLNDKVKLGSELSALLLRQARLEEAIARAWIVGLGRRSASERMAHLLCELRERFAAIGMATENTFELRVGQVELADTLGVSPIHANRALKALREAELIKLKGGTVTFLDRPALEELALFDPAYLRL